MTVEIEEEERQVILLALAELALSRPGWNNFLTETAKNFGQDNALTMFENFKKTSADRVAETHKPLLAKS